MPRVKDPGVMALYADIATLEAKREISDRTVRLAASLRGDMAGTPSNLLLNPITYQERVSRVWDGYNIDPLFQRLVNRTIEFSANGSKWEIPTGRDGESWLDKIKNWMESGGEGEKLEREEEFWNLWASRINFGVPNILPGLNEITSWAAKHLLLSGMFIPVWELGRMKFGKMELLVPVKMSCYPATAIALVRPANAFENEWSFLRLPQGVNAVKIEGQPNLAQQNIMPTGGSASGYQALPRMLSDAKDGSRESFTIKFNYTPGDLVTIRRGAMSTGETMYPPVPFASLLSQIVTRQKLFAADLAILDGIVNYIEMWKIGDKDHPPQAPQYKGTKLEKDGTIAQIRKLIQDGRVGPAMQLFVPYYVDLVIKMPESEVLLSEKKYVQSTLEIFQCFPPDQIVTTRRGHLPIGDVHVDDEVLTHRGHWKRVTQVHTRDYNGELVGLTTGAGRRIWCTPGHAILSRYRKKAVYWHKQQQAWRWYVGPRAVPDPPLWKLASSLEGGDLVFVPRDVESYEDRQPTLEVWADHAVDIDGMVHLTITGRHPERWCRSGDVVLPDLTTSQINVWNTLGTEPKTVAAVIAESGCHLVTVYRALSYLEQKGYAIRCAPAARPAGSDHPRAISMPRHVVVDESLAEVLGLYLAEGCVIQRYANDDRRESVEGIAFAFHRNETEMHGRVVEIMRDRFGVDSTLAVIGNAVRIAVHSRLLGETFKREFSAGGIAGAGTKCVPAWLIEAPRRIVAAWIRGLFKGDGTYQKGKWSLGVVSRELVFQAADAIRRLGFRVSVSDYANGIGHQRVWVVSVSNREPSFHALMTHGEVPDAGQSEVWMSIRDPQQRHYAGPVIDLTVDEDHSFVVEGLCVSNSFGIFFSRAQGARERMEKINIANFEEFVSWLRAKIAAFYQMLAMHIVELNPGKLSRVPLWTPNPLNTKSQEFMEALYRLSEMGKISFRTLLRYHGLDDNVELRRLANELGTDVDDVTDANVPLRFVQSTDIGGQDPNNPSPGPKRGRDKEIAIPPTQQRGRPRKKLTK